MSSTSSEGTSAPKPTHIVSIEILGVSFSIKTDQSPEYIEGLVAELKERLSSVSSRMKIVDPLKLALVTNLLTLDELRGGGPERESQTLGESEATSLLDSLDRRLGELGL